MIHKLLLIFLFSLLSCGKSPFLDEVDSDTTPGQGDNLSKQIELDTSIRDGQSTGGNSIEKYDFTGVWQVGPSTSGKNKMLVIINDHAGNRASIDYDLHSFLWMPEMGHGSVPITITKISDGLYELTNIVFIMPGLWDIHFEFKNNNVVVEEVVWELNL
jgi:hypothetical protein